MKSRGKAGDKPESCRQRIVSVVEDNWERSGRTGSGSGEELDSALGSGGRRCPAHTSSWRCSALELEMSALHPGRSACDPDGDAAGCSGCA